MKNTSDFLYKNSNLKLAILFTAIFIGYLFFVMIPHAADFEVLNDNIKSLGMKLGFDQADIVVFLNVRTDAMVDAYINFNRIWDTLFGLIYGLMYVVWLSVLFKPFSKKNDWAISFDKLGIRKIGLVFPNGQILAKIMDNIFFLSRGPLREVTI